MGTFIDWLPIISTVVIGFVVWAFNQIITKKIDELETTGKETRRMFFEKLDLDRTLVDDKLKEYVRNDLYRQAHAFMEQKSDEKYKNILEKIEDLKVLVIKSAK